GPARHGFDADRAKGRRVRSEGIPQSLRRRAAPADRGEAEEAGREDHRGPGGQRAAAPRLERRRPDGRAQEEPWRRQGRGGGRRQEEAGCKEAGAAPRAEKAAGQEGRGGRSQARVSDQRTSFLVIPATAGTIAFCWAPAWARVTS